MSPIEDQIAAVFHDAGCRGWLRAQRIDGDGPVVDVNGHEPVVAASVYKLVVLVAAARAFDSGDMDPHAQVRVVPSDCTPGPTGISTFTDPVTLSWLDLVRSMITVSDNAAADIVLGALGFGIVEQIIADFELGTTRIVGGTAALHGQLVHDTGALSLAEAVGLLASNSVVHETAAYDPAYTTATSVADTNVLLSAIWEGRAASPRMTIHMKTILSQQIWPHRIRSALPYSDVTVAGKTGTIGPIRNEVAVVVFPDETPIAVSVFTRAARSDLHLPVVDQAIGRVARIAVTALR